MRQSKILVADDDRDSAETLADLLRLHGFEVAVAFDGAQAVEMIRTFSPALAIIDIDMPGLDGYETARLLCRESGSMPKPVLVAHTSHASAADVVRARAAGFDHHLSKDAFTGVLLALVDGLVSQPKSAGCIPPK